MLRRIDNQQTRGAQRPRRTSGIGAAVLILLALILFPTGPAVHAHESAAPQVRRHVRWLAAAPSRVVGSEGHAAVQKRLLELVRGIPGVRVWTQEFTVVVPQVHEANLTVTGGRWKGPHRVYPLWPAGVRLNTTPAEGITGRLIYVREGAFEDLPVKRLSGQIAVMEMTGGAAWRALFGLGVRAVVLLGSEGETFSHARTHVITIPVNFPRFYLPEGDLADALRRGEITQARLLCRAGWREATATNIYALVGAPVGPGRSWKGSPPQAALAVAVPFDSMSLVPELAPGADAAVDAALALELLHRMAKRPPARPVLFAFVDACGVRRRGVREMLLSLGTSPETREKLQEKDRPLLKKYRAHEELAAGLDREGDPLGRLHLSKYRPLHRYAKQEVQKEVLKVDEELGPLRLRFYSASEDERDELKRGIRRLEEKRNRFFAALAVVVGRQERPGPTGAAKDAPEAHPYPGKLAAELWGRARRRIRGQLASLDAAFEADRSREELRLDVLRALGFRERESGAVRPVAFLLGLDVSDAGVAVGPSLQDNFLGVNETRNAEDFCRWLQGLYREDPGRVWPEALMRAVNLALTGAFDMEALAGSDEKGFLGVERDTLPRSVNLTPLKGLESPSSHVVGTMANLTAAAESFGVPAMTWATLDGWRVRVDTPRDRPELLDWERLAPQVDATVALVEAWADDEGFTPSRKTTVPRVLRVRGHIVDQAMGEPVARVPMHGYLTTLLPGTEKAIWGFPVVPGVRHLEFTPTGVDGRFTFDGVAGHTSYRHWALASYRVAGDGSVLRAVNQQAAGKGVRLAFRKDVHEAPPLRAVVFTCREWCAADLFDPRFLMPLPQGTVLDARRGGPPKRASLLIHDGMMSCLLEHGVPWQILLRAGIVGNRMVMVNMLPADESTGLSTRESMRGFGSGPSSRTGAPEGLPSHPFYVAAQDFYNLDARRLADYRKAGITSRPIEKLQEKTLLSLEKAREAFEMDKGADFFRHATEALANEVRAYNAVRDTAGDVVRGAIFLLLLLVPFSYAMERLLFASPHIYRQIGGAIGVFAVMATVLWISHPAFRMTRMPMMIVMAFAVIFVSLMVIFMIFSKFETELMKIRSGMAETSAAKTSRYGLLMTAVRLGIANMRKRKLRTALTGITVMLITFCLLCFMSTSTYVGRREFAVDTRNGLAQATERAARKPSVLVRQPQERRMPEVALTYLQNLVGDERRLMPRYWWSNPRDTQWRLHARNLATGKQVSLSAALGLSGGEAAVTGIDRVCPRWDEFGSAELPPRRASAEVYPPGRVRSGGPEVLRTPARRAPGCYLAASTAEALGIRPGDEVVIAGQALVLTGTFDPSRFDREIRRLDGKPLVPPDYSTIDEQQRRSRTRDDLQTLALQMAGRLSWEDEEEIEPLSSALVAILPADLLRGMENYTLRSVAIPVGSEEEARTVASSLSEKLAFPVYFGGQEGVRVLASIPLVPKAPKSVLIPLLIAGLIIFNTMLSSLAERKRDIYIYTSLGLAPLHIGVLFLAEAVTYGLLGSIAGYTTGQAVAKAFTELGWMGGMTLNFGGGQAITTMALVLGVVVVSSLVPAYLAGRVAAPSGKTRWRVPPPEKESAGQVIRDTLPFTATVRTAEGLAAFLHDYFDAHRDGTIGSFTTGDLRARRFSQYGLDRVTLSATVWLAPYDLGVRQDVSVMLSQDAEEKELYGISVELWHGSGQIGTWRRLNRTFLADLRRQLLGWRKLLPERLVAYIDRGKTLV